MTYLKIGCVMIVMLGLICLSHYYLARCIYGCIHSVVPKLRLFHVIIVLSLLTVMMILSVARPFPAVLQRVISVIGVFWMGLFVYLLLYFLLADAISLLARLIPSSPVGLSAATRISALFLAVLTVFGGFIHTNRIRTATYSVTLTEQADRQMRVVMLSDVHLGAVNSEARLQKIVDAINEQKPDLVCIAGDIFDNDYSAILNPDSAIEKLKGISSTYGVYACLGNHDSGSEFDKMLDFLERANVRLLKDEYTVINSQIVLAGRLDASPIGSYNGEKRRELSAVLEGADLDMPIIVLDHNPANPEQYKGEADLVLSGHTHKGQIFPGGLITNAMYTVDYGYYRTSDGTQIIVSSGAGTWGLPVRVGTNCEIVSIDLKY